MGQLANNAKPAPPKDYAASFPEQGDMTESQRREVNAIGERMAARSLAPMAEIKRTDDGKLICGPGGGESVQLYSARLMDAFGTSSPELAEDMLNTLLNHLEKTNRTGARATNTNAALAFVSEMRTADPAEAMLLLQMWLTQDAASRALAMVGTSDFVDQAKLYGNLAVKLQRTLTTQMDTLAKLRRGGVQRVQHDHFYHVDNRGGQAVFGPVVQGGANGNIEHQSHATDISGALGPPMPCTDAAGNVVPISCREGQEAVPDARRDESRRVPGE